MFGISTLYLFFSHDYGHTPKLIEMKFGINVRDPKPEGPISNGFHLSLVLKRWPFVALYDRYCQTPSWAVIMKFGFFRHLHWTIEASSQF